MLIAVVLTRSPNNDPPVPHTASSVLFRSAQRVIDNTIWNPCWVCLRSLVRHFHFIDIKGDMSDFIRVQEFVAHSTKVNCLAIGPNSNQVLATGGEDSKVNIWRVGSVENIWTLGYNKSPIECVCFDSGEQCVVSGAMNGSIKVFDLNEGKLARNLGSHQVSVTTMQYHPYGEFLVTGSADCTMKFWDLRAKSCVETYTGHKKELTCVRFSPDGKWVASSAKDGQLIIFDLVATKHIDTIRTAPAYINTFEFNPLELAVVASTSARYVRSWDLDGMTVLNTTPAESAPISALAVPDSGSSLYTTSRGGMKIWELDTFRLKENIEVGWQNIADMRVADDDQIVAASFNSNFVSVWQVDVGQVLEARQQQAVSADDHVPRDRDSSRDRAVGSEKRLSGADYSPHHVAPSKTPPTSVAPPQQPSSGRAGQLMSVAEKLEQIKLDYDSYSAQFNGAKEVPAADSKVSQRYSGNNSHHNQLPPASSAKYSGGGVDSGRESPDSDCWADDKSHNNHAGPQVVVDAQAPPVNMAASLGESFWNKLAKQQSQQNNHVQGQQQYQPSVTELRREIEAELLGGATEPNEWEDEQIEVPFDELDDLLPPSAFDHPSKPVVAAVPSTSSAIDKGDAKVADRPVPAVRAKPTVPASHANVATRNRPGAAPSSSGAVAGGREAKHIPVEVLVPQQQQQYVAAGKAIRLTSPELAKAVHRSASNIAVGNGVDDAFGHETSRCHDLVDRLTQASSSALSTLSQRMATLKLLRQTWNKGDILGVLDHLQTLSEAMVLDNPQNVGIIVDFLVGVDLKGNFLSLDACVQLLPIIDTVVSYSTSRAQTTDIVVFASYKALVDLAQGFGELIRSTRSMMVAGGVDLTREERLNKCNTCYQVFNKAKQRLEIVRHQNRNHGRVLAVLDQYQRLAANYFQ